MNTSNLVFLGLLFLLTNNGTISLTQTLLLITLLSTTLCCQNNCNNNQNFNFSNTTVT